MQICVVGMNEADRQRIERAMKSLTGGDVVVLNGKDMNENILLESARFHFDIAPEAGEDAQAVAKALCSNQDAIMRGVGKFLEEQHAGTENEAIAHAAAVETFYGKEANDYGKIDY